MIFTMEYFFHTFEVIKSSAPTFASEEESSTRRMLTVIGGDVVSPVLLEKIRKSEKAEELSRTDHQPVSPLIQQTLTEGEEGKSKGVISNISLGTLKQLLCCAYSSGRKHENDQQIASEY